MLSSSWWQCNPPHYQLLPPSHTHVNEQWEPILCLLNLLILKKYFNFGFLVHKPSGSAPLYSVVLYYFVRKWKVQSSGHVAGNAILSPLRYSKGYFNAPKTLWSSAWHPYQQTSTTDKVLASVFLRRAEGRSENDPSHVQNKTCVSTGAFLEDLVD